MPPPPPAAAAPPTSPARPRPTTTLVQRNPTRGGGKDGEMPEPRPSGSRVRGVSSPRRVVAQGTRAAELLPIPHKGTADRRTATSHRPEVIEAHGRSRRLTRARRVETTPPGREQATPWEVRARRASAKTDGGQRRQRLSMTAHGRRPWRRGTQGAAPSWAEGAREDTTAETQPSGKRASERQRAFFLLPVKEEVLVKTTSRATERPTG